MDDLAQIYDASRHPDVIDGKKTPEHVYMDFLKLWDTQTKDGIVTYEEFAEYYMDISAGIEDDDLFAEVMEHSWKLGQ